MSPSTRGETQRRNSPSGPDRSDDHSHALRAGKGEGGSQRKQPQAGEAKTRDAGRDDRRSGSDSGRH